MRINDWSEDILIAEVSDEPQFSEDMSQLMKRIEDDSQPTPSVIVDMKDVSFLNSTNIAQLLRLRQTLANANQGLRVCSVVDPVWSMLLITGLDKIFDFTDDVATALASLQIEEVNE